MPLEYRGSNKKKITDDLPIWARALGPGHWSSVGWEHSQLPSRDSLTGQGGKARCQEKVTQSPERTLLLPFGPLSNLLPKVNFPNVREEADSLHLMISCQITVRAKRKCEFSAPSLAVGIYLKSQDKAPCMANSTYRRSSKITITHGLNVAEVYFTNIVVHKQNTETGTFVCSHRLD